MKFSISFKYSNVTFKNKENKETVSFDTKAETGNTFTFDNVDEDVVLGIVKGIKDRKASQVFAYDDFRTNFINVMARNKCKELYDKLDKGEWKIGDIAISNITIKDLEFTKPTMNAREALTVESRRKVSESIYDNNLDEALNLLNEAAASLHMAMWDIKKELGKDSELFKHVERNYNDVHETYGIMEGFMDKAGMNESKKMRESIEFMPGDIVDWFVPEDDEQYGKEFGGEVFHGGEVYKKQGDVYEVSFGEEGLFYPQGKDLEYHSENLLESRKMNEDFKDTMRKENQEDLSDLIEVVTKAIREIDIISNMYDVSDTSFEKLQNVRTMLLNALPSTKTAKKMGWCNESKEEVEVEFKKTPDDGTVIAFFP